MKQEIENIIKKNLPEKTPFCSKLCQNRNGLDYCGTCEQAWEYCSCSARNTGFNKALSQINTSLIADEVLKVVVDKIKEQKIKGGFSEISGSYNSALDDILSVFIK